MPWEKTYDRTEVLECAMRAFWARGYEATSMADLVGATGLNRGSIYAAFDGKRSLFIEALRHYDRVHRKDHLAQIAAGQGPRDAILAVFESAAASEASRPGGCLLVNTALELSPHDAEIREFINACLGEVETFFFEMIEAARREGTIAPALPARETAGALLGLFLGLRVLTRSGAGKSAAAAIIRQARAMLG